VVIDGTVNARRFLLGVDQGSITVNGTINATGQTGGTIDLIASGQCHTRLRLTAYCGRAGV
jgi:hypothetical protein